MTRPASHRVNIAQQRCANCRHGLWPLFKYDRLCFCGDDVIVRSSNTDKRQSIVYLHGREVGLQMGDDWDEICAGRVVNEDDVCDEWQPTGEAS